MTKKVMYLGVITGEEFEKKYNELAISKDKTPIASTIIPLQEHQQQNNNVDGVNPASLLFSAWVYYEEKTITPTKEKVVLKLE